MDDEARRWQAAYEEKAAVLEAVKAHIRVWLDDKRMKIWAKVLLDTIERIETEQAKRPPSSA